MLKRASADDIYVHSLQWIKRKIIRKGLQFDERSGVLVKKILELIKILNIPLIAQVMLKVFMDLKSLVSIILYNPVLHNTAGHAPHAYVSSARINIYKEESFS